MKKKSDPSGVAKYRPTMKLKHMGLVWLVPQPLPLKGSPNFPTSVFHSHFLITKCFITGIVHFRTTFHPLTHTHYDPTHFSFLLNPKSTETENG